MSEFGPGHQKIRAGEESFILFQAGTLTFFVDCFLGLNLYMTSFWETCSDRTGVFQKSFKIE